LVSNEEIDDAKVDRLQRACDSAEGKLCGLRAAVDTVRAQIAEAEFVLAGEQDKINRAAAFEKLSREVEEIATIRSKWLAITRRFHDALNMPDAQSFESEQLAGFLMHTTASQVEVAASFIVGEWRGLVESVRSGHADIPGRKTEPQIVELVPVGDPVRPPEETETIFTLRALRYHDLDGRTVTVQCYEDHPLPKRLINRALARGVITLTSDPRRRTHRGLLGGDFPRNICDLDSELQPPTSDLPAGFEPLPSLPPERKIAFKVESAT
jgi:hypothetical protein